MKQQTRRSIASSRKGAPQVVGVLAVVALLLAFCLPPLLGTVLGLGETTVLPDEATPTGSGVEREDITGSDAEQGAITGAGAEVARTFSPLHQANSLVAQTLEDSWEYRVHFLAVGDNLIDDALSSYADGQAGEMGDGLFDFSPIYAPVAPYVRAADLAYINNETHLWDAVSPRGYPSFNAPEAVAPAVVGAGFDLVASATNHSYDWGFDACANNAEVWGREPVAFVGTAATEKQSQRIVIIRKNNIRFALLDYTYGINGYDSIDPPWAVSLIDEQRIRADVTAAHAQADVVVVAMHWGIENQTSPSDFQLQYAQLLADLDVDLVLGSHPHVIGELHWVEGVSGHRTLVAYSLGNFVSHHVVPSALNELEGMLTCDFVKQGGEVRIENIVWTPLVNHTEADYCAVYALPDYTPELAARHVILQNLDDPLGWLRTETATIIGPDWTIQA